MIRKAREQYGILLTCIQEGKKAASLSFVFLFKFVILVNTGLAVENYTAYTHHRWKQPMNSMWEELFHHICP
jgi:hypothetical protein